MKLLAAALLSLGLAACSSTSLEVLPTGADANCPAEVRGGFVGLDSNTGADSAFGVFVDEQCAVQVYDREKDRKAAPVAVKTHWRAPYVLIDRHDAEAIDAAPASKSDPLPETFRWLLFGWARDGDTLSIRHVDHRRVATLIVNGALAGETRWRGKDGDNVLTGSPDELAAVLERFDLLGDAPPAELRYVGRERKALERALAKAKR